MNFAQWLQVFAASLQQVAPVVEAIHPNDATEATKINSGVAIATLLANTVASAQNVQTTPQQTAIVSTVAAAAQAVAAVTQHN